MLSVALASGGLAASQVRERERGVAAQIGPAVPVLVATRDLRAGASVSRRELTVRRVPARFVPPDALTASDALAGARTVVPIVAGGYVTAGLFEGSNDGQRGGVGVGRGERAVTVEVSGTAGLAVGSRVDVLVSTESGAGGGRTLMALAGAELLGLAPPSVSGAAGDAGTGAEPGAGGPTALATLRVTLRQAVYLTAADNFAREVRLLARPPGDRSAAGATVSQGQL
jgi:pilus assembly protein CpaB